MKKSISYLIAILLLFCMSGQAAYAKVTSNVKETSSMQGLCSDGPNDSHELFAKQSLKILENDKGAAAVEPFNKYKNLFLEYCDKPDSDEKDYVFAYHFYNPYTQENYLPSSMSASKITALTKFKEHIQNAVNYYKSEKAYAMKELGRAIHFLEDVNVPHHASNQVGVITSHTQYEEYISNNNSLFYVTTSNAYNKYSNMKFMDFSVSIFDECAKNAYSYKSVGQSYDEAEWRSVAKPTLKLAQENVAALLYRFSKEVK